MKDEIDGILDWKKDAGVGVGGKIGSSSCSARTGTLSSTSSGTVAVVTGG